MKNVLDAIAGTGIIIALMAVIFVTATMVYGG